MTIGEIIKEYRKKNNLSQREFANRCGLSNGSISLMEKGINPKTNEPIIPSLPTLNTLAKGMGMTIDELLERMGDTEVSLSRTSDRRQNTRTAEFVKLFNLLNSEQQKLIIAQIRGILASQSSDDASEPTQKIWLAASSSGDQAPAIVEVSKAKVKAAQDDHSLKNEEDL